MKRFYNNTKMSGVFSKTLRVIALLCVLMGFSSSAWSETCYVDATSIINIGHTVERVKLQYHQSNSWHDVSLNNIANGLWSFEGLTNVTFQMQVQIDGNYKDWFNVTKYLTPKNSITLSYTNNKVGYTWTERNPYMGMPIYFQPGSDWKADNAWFAVYFFDDKNHAEWKILKPSICDPSAFVTTTPNYADWNWSKFEMIFCRMNPASNELGWNNVWTQTVNQERYDDWIDDGMLNKFNTGRTWAQIITPWDSDSNPNNNSSDATIQWYNTSCTEQAELYSLAGTFNNWSVTSHSFEVGKGATGTVELELTAGTYKFKLVKNKNNWYGNGAKITTQTEAIKIDGNSADCTLSAGFDGVYTFTFGENWVSDGSGGKEQGMWLKVEYGKSKEPVLIAHPAQYLVDNKVKLDAYIQNTYCEDAGAVISDWGFVICPGNATKSCTPTVNSVKKYPATREPKQRGEIFEHTLSLTGDNLLGGVVYGYRAYVTIGGKMYLSAETGTFFFAGQGCTQQEVDLVNKTPIVYTVDASLGEEYADDCNLRYGSLQKAIDALKATKDNEDEYQYVEKDGDKYNLRVPVVMNVHFYDDTPDDQSKAYCYEGNQKAGISGGGSSSENSKALILKDFNSKNNDTKNTLTLKGVDNTAENKNRPWIHHIILRDSRNIVLDNLGIFSDPSGNHTDDALEFDLNNGSFWDINVDKDRDHNILVKNCMIGSNGFTGLHASGYDGITFENNEFEAVMASSSDAWTQNNAINWGASAKFMMCSNVKFVRNNFRGAHATLVWLQECQDVLFMNNVFWNTNQYNHEGCSAIRVVAQYDGEIKNHGFYFNTFFLENNDNNKNYNFLKFDLTTANGGGSAANYYNGDVGAIAFKYNNCYSYDTDVPGRNSDPFLGLKMGEGKFANVCQNNFWSEYDKIQNKVTSVFAFGCSADYTNVSSLVCKTTATGPASLVIKGGDALNINLTSNEALAEEISAATNVSLTENEVAYDRYNADIRPGKDSNNEATYNKWTYGAYQGMVDVPVTTIYWLGISDKWDDRNNWGYYADEATRNPNARATDMQRLSCICNLSENLKVIIPEHPLVQVPDPGRQWPVIPASFEASERATTYGIPAEEQVSAGLGMMGVTPTKFAHTIEIEYGAALKGVTDLKNGSRHYTQGKMHFEAPRSKWVLVGTIVQPFMDDTKPDGDVRNLISGEFQRNFEPHVYMRQASIKDNNVSWGEPVPNMSTFIDENAVFALNAPDEYGKYKIPSIDYYTALVRDPSKLNDGQVPINYDLKPGRFVRESEHISVSIEKGENKLLSNSYPCNISAKKIEDKNAGNVSYYNYTAATFMPLGTTDVEIKPQHGFMVTGNGKTLKLDSVYVDGNTRSRNAEISLPTFELNLHNANNPDGGYSMVVVRYDETLGNTDGPVSSDTKKIFAFSDLAPDLYMIMYNDQYARLNIGDKTQSIPLGIRLRSAMNVRFEQISSDAFAEILLIDTQTGESYNLLGRSYTTETLPVGDNKDRFFLQFTLEEGDNNYQEDTDDDISTDIAETTNSNIQIFAGLDGDNSIMVVANNVQLQTIYVSDMLGRTTEYKVSGNSASLRLPVYTGVYIVKVIGDTSTRTEKVILK
ncbi:MAG: T9SS type A sorting domain-containing protein [Paludibacteraceae bacterium]|nr:T9SS type A sorting domain-containing protein [Paludibacteraceae bacterium]